MTPRVVRRGVVITEKAMNLRVLNGSTPRIVPSLKAASLASPDWFRKDTEAHLYFARSARIS